MDETEPSSASKPRTSQACQRCRSLKTRCLPSEQPGICQRCFNAKRECIWADAPRRARKFRTPSRISQVEQKIDGLVASLVNSSVPRDDGTSAPAEASCPINTSTVPRDRNNRPIVPGNWLPFPPSFTPNESSSSQDTPRVDQDAELDGQYLEKLRTIHSFSDNTDLSRPPENAFHGSKVNEHSLDSDIIKNLLSSGEADSLLNEYRSMASSFPFVPLQAETTAQELCRTKPMLFFAMITAASFREHQRQMALDKLFRTELATRTIIRPRRTLALLQSVLVYLSWYHFMFSHKTQQIYFLQQVAVGLALDLGLHRKSRAPPANFIGIPRPQLSETEQLERERTFLGCYFLSSLISGGLQKPNLLKYTEYMGQCGRNLKSAQQYPSDNVLSHLISLRRLDDQIYDMFYSEDTVDIPITDPRIQMNLRFMQSQLESTKGEDYGDTFQRTLFLSHSFTDMQLHSIALRSRGPSSQVIDLSPDNLQLNALLSALEAGKRFLDHLLLFPATSYHLIPFTEWMHIPVVIITMARLCIPSDAHTAVQWDVKTAQDRVRLDLCMESLCYRMHSLSTYEPIKQPHHDFWWAMRMIMDLTRQWYCRKIAPKTTSTMPSQTSGTSLPTPDDTIEDGTTMSGPTPSSSSSANENNPQTLPLGGLIGSANMDIDMSVDDDVFSFMRDADFDMGKFVDAGIWGDELYSDMGFGGGGGGMFF